MKPDLGDVTICTVDSVNVELATRALNRSVAQCKFAEAILFSHVPAHGAFRVIQTDRIDSTVAYSQFVFKHLPQVVETPFVLLVQWDGYVIDANAWSDTFRDFDYIGARWPFVSDDMAVGNGGFSLRSRKFMSALMEPGFPIHASGNSDWLVCRSYRPRLEGDFGIRFAPAAVADRFSYETVAYDDLTKQWPPTFGFHGLSNLWRHVDDAGMIEIIDRLAPYVFRTAEYAKLVLTYFLLGNMEVFSALYARMKAHFGNEALPPWLRKIVGEPDV